MSMYGNRQLLEIHRIRDEYFFIKIIWLTCLRPSNSFQQCLYAYTARLSSRLRQNLNRFKYLLTLQQINQPHNWGFFIAKN